MVLPSCCPLFDWILFNFVQFVGNEAMERISSVNINQINEFVSAI